MKISWDPPDDLIEAVRTWLGSPGRLFFGRCLAEHGRLDPVLNLGGLPHPLHFREGMHVRNFFRTRPDESPA